MCSDAASLEWLRKEMRNIKGAVGEGAVVGGFPKYTDVSYH